MRLLITGATGFVGQHLVSKLLDQGFSLSLLSRDQSRSSPFLIPLANKVKGSVEILDGDVRNYNLVARAIRDAQPEIVVHLAAVGVSNPFLSPYEAIRVNLTGTVNLLRACFDNRIASASPARLLVARTPHEKQPSTIYAASKLAAWNFCQSYVRAYDWPIVGLMLFQVYGPGQPDQLLVQGAIRAALQGQDFPLTSGSQVRDWIYIDDAVAAIIAAIERPLNPGTALEIGTGAGTTVEDVAKTIYRLVDGAGRPLIGVLPDRNGESSRMVADVITASDLLGWRAAIPLVEGLERTIAHAISQQDKGS